MRQINRALITPIVALVILYLKSVMKIDLPNDVSDIITDACLAVLALIGIFMHPTDHNVK